MNRLILISPGRAGFQPILSGNRESVIGIGNREWLALHIF
jgi:hypothetical protein